MSQEALRFIQRASGRKTALSVAKIPWNAIYFLAFLGALAMLIFYVFGINQLTEGTYVIKNYNKEIKMLLAENRDLEIAATKYSLLQDAEAQASQLGFEKSTNITYLQILPTSLAKAK